MRQTASCSLPTCRGEPLVPADERAVGLAESSYRDLMSRFPTGVAVVTTVDRDGGPRGMTCSSLTSVTLRPPTLLVSLGSASATWMALRREARFAVNLIHARGQRTAELFATPGVDRFAMVPWRASPSGLPWLFVDAFALAECRVTGTKTVGDHVLVLGEVRASVVDHDVPLIYGLRRFTAWPG